MRTIHRNIVGGFIFSKDGRLLLGKNRKGGVYEGCWVVPGGGVDAGETKADALRREMLEETGIDTKNATMSEFNSTVGECEKTLRGAGERVLVNRKFYSYRIDLPHTTSEISIRAEDGRDEPQWFTLRELKDKNLSPPTRLSLLETGLLGS